MAETIVSAITLDIIIGATFETVITWMDEAETLVPLPPGTLAEAKVRPALSDDDVLCRFSTDPDPSDGVLTLVDPGVTRFLMSAANTELLAPITDAVFDIKYTFEPGTPTERVIVKLAGGQGLVNIGAAVTRV